MSKTEEIKIEKNASLGFGLGHLGNGRVVLIKKALPGDVIEAEIIKTKKNLAFGFIKKIIKPSKDRIKPICPYFDQCGGCDYQNISYDKQLEIKQSLIDESLERNNIDIKANKIIPGSNQHFFYRNSIRFMFDLDSKNHFHIARHAYPDERRLVQVDKCLLQSEASNLIAKKIVDFINVNVSNKKSFWQLKIREGKKTTEFMIEIITSSHDLPGEKGIIENLKSIRGIRSIYHTIAPAKSLLNLKRRLIFGSPVIYEKIGRYTFQISPESFFQTNSEGVKTLYDTIKKIANVKIGDELLDLFCGTGSIGIYLSTLAKKVTGIEVVPQAIRNANDNARINKIKNIEFICSDADKIRLQEYAGSIIVIDPPRAGLSKELIKKISEISWKRIVYVSCNPPTFARDLKLFEKNGVLAQKIQPIDMFPQTHHTELVAELKRKDYNIDNGRETH